MGLIKEARKDAAALVRSLREARGIPPGAPARTAGGGVDRRTSLALGQIMAGIAGIERKLEPTAAEERSLLL